MVLVGSPIEPRWGPLLLPVDPPRRRRACAGGAKISLNGGLAQSVECVVRNDEAPGSKPGFSIAFAPPRARIRTGAIGVVVTLVLPKH